MIAWGGAYTRKGRTRYLQGLQAKLLKIINKNNFMQQKFSLIIEQTFVYVSLIYHYKKLQRQYFDSAKTTKHKSLQIPRRRKG